MSNRGLKHSEVLSLLSSLVAEAWLDKSRDGFYSLTPRSLTELWSWLMATYNDPDLTQRLASALEKSLGKENVIKIDPLMVSEDFGRFGLGGKIPTVMMHVGATDPARIASGERVPGLHSSGFIPVPEPTLRTAIKSMTTMALELLR